MTLKKLCKRHKPKNKDIEKKRKVYNKWPSGN